MRKRMTRRPCSELEFAMTNRSRSKNPSTTYTLDRRKFLQRSASAAAALPAATVAGVGPAQAQEKTINVASFGGVVQDYQTRLFARPFEAKTGIKVNIGPNASLALT